MKITYKNKQFTAELGNGLQYLYNTETRTEQTLRKGEVVDYHTYSKDYEMPLSQFIKNCESVLEFVPVKKKKASSECLFLMMGISHNFKPTF